MLVCTKVQVSNGISRKDNWSLTIPALEVASSMAPKGGLLSVSYVMLQNLTCHFGAVLETMTCRTHSLSFSCNEVKSGNQDSFWPLCNISFGEEIVYIQIVCARTVQIVIAA